MEKLQDLCSTYSARHKTDLIFLNANIEVGMEFTLYDLLRSRDLQKNALLVLVTEGGLPETAYKIGRMLQRAYDNLDILVPGWCNSAGTILAIAARRLYLTDVAELGPIDLQLPVNDGSNRRSSSLELKDGINALGGSVYSLFEQFFDRISSDYGPIIPFNKRLDTATALTRTFVDNLTRQITPEGLGENLRDCAVGAEYSRRLNTKYENLKGDALDRLVNCYPTHGFIIDIQEAGELFHHVLPATGEMQDVLDVLGPRFWRTLKEPEIRFLNAPKGSASAQVVPVGSARATQG